MSLNRQADYIIAEGANGLVPVQPLSWISRVWGKRITRFATGLFQYASFMTQLEKLDVDRKVILKCGELDVIHGLLTKEWNAVREDYDRRPYYEWLTKLRQKISSANLD